MASALYYHKILFALFRAEYNRVTKNKPYPKTTAEKSLTWAFGYTIPFEEDDMDKRFASEDYIHEESVYDEIVPYPFTNNPKLRCYLYLVRLKDVQKGDAA